MASSLINLTQVFLVVGHYKLRAYRSGDFSRFCTVKTRLKSLLRSFITYSMSLPFFIVKVKYPLRECF